MNKCSLKNSLGDEDDVADRVDDNIQYVVAHAAVVAVGDDDKLERQQLKYFWDQ